MSKGKQKVHSLTGRITSLVMNQSWKAVRRNRGSAGIDKVSLGMFEQNLEANLARLMRELKDGSYRPLPTRRVYIPKDAQATKFRPLGIPAVRDRIAQEVLRRLLNPIFEAKFHDQSYGFRPGRNCHQAVAKVLELKRQGYRWVLDADVSGFFDNLDWELVLKALRHHTDIPWILLYVERWLKAPVQRTDGSLEERTKGSPQGAVISPLLSNLFMHYAFDEWLRRNFPHIQFARYADDAVIHARSLAEAKQVLEAVRSRLLDCGLELHPEKTKIVYCQDSDRSRSHDHIQFDFLGYTFRPRRAKNAGASCSSAFSRG